MKIAEGFFYLKITENPKKPKYRDKYKKVKNNLSINLFFAFNKKFIPNKTSIGKIIINGTTL